MVSLSKVMSIIHFCHVLLVLKIPSISICNPNKASCFVISKISIIQPSAPILFPCMIIRDGKID